MKVVVWLLISLVLLGIAYSFSTCQSEKTQGRVVLTLFDWPFAVQIKLDSELINIFEAENPDIKVLLVTGDSPKYMTMVTAGVAPEIATTGYEPIPYYAERGTILPLDDLIEADEQKRKAIVSLDKIADPAARRKAVMSLDDPVAADAARRKGLSALDQAVAAGRKFSYAEYFNADNAEILALDNVTSLAARRRALFTLDESVAADAGRRQALAEMDKAVADGGTFSCAEYFDARQYFSRDDYFPAMLKSVTYNGKIYGLPATGSPVAIIYNRDMFDRYNREYPDGPKLEYPSAKWTWDDYRIAAQKLTQDRDNNGRVDVFGTSIGFHNNRFPMFIWQSGGEVLSKDKRRCLMDSPEAIRGIQFMYDILWKYECAPTFQTQIEGASQQEEGTTFKEGRIAMLLTTRYSYSKLMEGGKLLTDFEWDIAPPPKNPDTGIRTSIYIGGAWTISAATRRVPEAWRMARFLVGDRSAELTMQAGRAIVANMAVAKRMTKGPGHKPDHDSLWIDTMINCRPKDFDEYRMGVAGPMYSKAMAELNELPADRLKPEEACINSTMYFNKALEVFWEKYERDRKEKEAGK